MPKIRKIDGISINKNSSSALFKKKCQNKPLLADDGIHLSNDYKINNVSKYTLITVDKLSPVIKKFPKFGKIIVFTCEKVIKLTEKF